MRCYCSSGAIEIEVEEIVLSCRYCISLLLFICSHRGDLVLGNLSPLRLRQAILSYIYFLRSSSSLHTRQETLHPVLVPLPAGRLQLATNSNSYLPLVGRSGLTFPNTCTANEENDADAGSGRKTTYKSKTILQRVTICRLFRDTVL